MENNRSDYATHITVLALLGLGLILLGMVGFHQYYLNKATVYSWFDCFYLSLQLIPLNSGGVTPPVPLQLNVARFALPVLTAYAFFSLIWLVFRNRILLFRLRRLRDHVIICGLGRKANFLARFYQAEKGGVVLIEKDPNNQYLQAYQQEFPNAPVLIANACDPAILRRAGLSQAKLLISTLGQDADNFSVAEAAKKALGGCGTRDPKAFDCKIDVSDYKMWTLFHETEFDRRHDAGDGPEVFNLNFFNVLESGARYVVNELRGQKYFNPEAYAEQNGIGIIGLSGLGELLILHIAREWSQLFRDQGKRMTLFVWDTDIKRKVETIHNKYPIVKDVCNLRDIELDVDNPLLITNTLPDCRDGRAVLPIYVCAEDQNDCVNLSMAAMRAYRALPVRIVVLLSEEKGLLTPLNNYRGASGKAELQAVNLLEKTCKPDVLDDGTHEALARAIHEVYSVRFVKKEDRQSWESLNKDEKAQNLDQALFIGTQLHSIGCGITPWIEYGAESFRFSEHEVEGMAKAEHERWMNKYKGWKYGPVKNKEKKEHPCLVPWITLPEEERDKDRNTVMQIPLYLAKAGFQIYRMRTAGT
jgi:hypothetical protein